MIGIPPEFIPSQLLDYEQASSSSRRLLEESCRYILKRDWPEAERRAISVRATSQRQAGQMVDRALAMIHLADIYRATGRMGPALEHSEGADLILKGQAGPTHDHNRGVANYALGLIHHELGNDSKAQVWYDQARERFGNAGGHWATEGNQKRQEQCERMIRWIEALTEAAGDQWGVLSEEIVASYPVLRAPGSSEGYGLVRLSVKGQQVDHDEIPMDSRLYTLLTPDGKQPFTQTLGCQERYFAVEIEQAGQGGQGTEAGDIALIQKVSAKAGPAGPGQRVGTGPYGSFFRDSGGSIFFKSQSPIIVGGSSSGPVTGEVIALLRPKP